MTEQVQVYGLRELREALYRKVPEHFQEKVLQKALSAGARLVVTAARQLAPKVTGTLARAIFMTRDKKNSNRVYEQRIIGVRSGKRFKKSKRDAFYWRFVEFGRAAITSRKALGSPEKGFFGKTVAAAKPKPFLRPAFAQRKLLSLEAIRQSLAAEIPIAAKKASWRTPSRP